MLGARGCRLPGATVDNSFVREDNTVGRLVDGLVGKLATGLFDRFGDVRFDFPILVVVPKYGLS